jgi:hypothetical protein
MNSSAYESVELLLLYLWPCMESCSRKHSTQFERDRLLDKKLNEATHQR